MKIGLAEGGVVGKPNRRSGYEEENYFAISKGNKIPE